MATQVICWGEDAHRSVIESLSWPDNSRLACCNRAFYNAKITCTSTNSQASWGQAQSTSRDVEDLVASLVRAAKVSPLFAHGKYLFLKLKAKGTIYDFTWDHRFGVFDVAPVFCILSTRYELIIYCCTWYLVEQCKQYVRLQLSPTTPG